MIIVDSALKKLQEQGKPINVAMVGAGFMAKGIALQIGKYVPGMNLAAISNRNIDRAFAAYRTAGIDEPAHISKASELDECIAKGKAAVTDDPFVLCDAEKIDAIIEVTGALEFSARVVMRAIKNGKHIILMNAELDGTVGSILKTYADKAGVVYAVSDGDQPGVIMNLYRFVKSLGVKPVLCGNIKGLHDPYRNPTTQEGFAKKWGQNPAMVTSFADGTKISFEQACVANATEMKVGKRGMFGPTVPSGTPIRETVNLYPREILEKQGIVDYVVGADPGPGVFVLGMHDDPVQKHYLNLYKLGEGPFYCFYTPYHLCHFEAPMTVARAVLFGDSTLAPIGKPSVEVITAAKRDLKAGEVLDGIGQYLTYGLAENTDVSRKEDLLPMGLSEGCKLKRDIAKDQVLTFDDVAIPEGRLIDKLWKEQLKRFYNKDELNRILV